MEYRKDKWNDADQSVDKQVLDCDEFRWFWIKLEDFTGANIQIGEGQVVGLNMYVKSYKLNLKKRRRLPQVLFYMGEGRALTKRLHFQRTN